MENTQELFKDETNFFELVRLMRRAQINYFQTRKKGALIHAKELEKKVDVFLMKNK